MRRSLCAVFFLLFGAAGATQAVSDPLSRLPSQLRFTFDRVVLPANEEMGLVGGNVLFEPVTWGYLGLGAYGAVTGQRGGFFTGGFEAGFRVPLRSALSLDAGLFLGGGGGGAAPQGGGLMLRPHAGLQWNTRYAQFGTGISRVRFPNGDIDSSQLYVSAEHHFVTLIRPGWPADDDLSRWRPEAGQGARFKRRWFTLQSLAYFPEQGTPGRSGKALEERMDLVGVRWRQRAGGSGYVEFETAGAWGGRVDGFAQVLLGGGVGKQLSPGLAMFAGALIGGAGGGDVHTGGGGIGRVYGGLSGRLTGPVRFTAEAGYTGTFDGEFSGAVGTLGVTYGYEPLAFDTVAEGGDVPGGAYRWARWRVRAVNQRYVPIGDDGRRDVTLAQEPVDLVGLKADTWIARGWFLTGQALGAYDGGAGGYAAGLVGGGYAPRLSGRLQPEVVLLIGAAGGGGIAVGSGFIVQPMTGLYYSFNDRLSGGASYGYVRAPSGTFVAHVVEVSLAYRFGTVHRAPAGRGSIQGL